MSDHCRVCDAIFLRGEEYCRVCGASALGAKPKLAVRLSLLVHTRRLVLINAVISTIQFLVCGNLRVWSPGYAVALMVALISAVVLVLLAVRTRYDGARKLGLVQSGCCILYAILRWSPAASVVPWFVPILLSLAWMIVILPVSLWVWKNHPAYNYRRECEECGYLLFGLPRPCCPECGTPFDPSRLTVLTSRADLAAANSSTNSC